MAIDDIGRAADVRRPGAAQPGPAAIDVETLRVLERKVLWLSSQIIHNANHVRENVDGLKVGGHQASSASLVTIMTALYFRILRPEDRVAVKPHASPVFHAIQYLFGNAELESLRRFRGFGGAQSYPSRTKDKDDVDFSTGSVGLGVAMTLFASLAQDYLDVKGWKGGWPTGRMVALMGDAELDEGNVFEALLEGWKHDVRNLWWVIDYNRQSLDSVVNDSLFQKHVDVFRSLGWEVVTLKYGRLLEEAFRKPGGDVLRRWIDDCPNMLYSALTFQGAWRGQLHADLSAHPDTLAIVDALDDEALARLMTNLGGHDMDLVVEAFETAPTDRPVCFIAYTVKGHGLPFQGHKDNHAGLMTKAQMETFRALNAIGDGEEWSPFAGLDRDRRALEAAVRSAPFNARGRRRLTAARIPVPPVAPPQGREQSTQEGFGRILAEIARDGGPLADRIVTMAPDVTVSTNLGPWVNRRALFGRNVRSDVFQERKLMSAQRWEAGPAGQHVELGIAENNLFLSLAAFGLSHSVFGERLIPIGTLYDPFVYRGLDALNHACYQDARFIVVGTPSGLTLAPEGGAHQSIGTPLVGIAQDKLAAFEPAFVDELAVILAWAFDYLQRDGSRPEGGAHPEWERDADGGSVYLRLTTRSIEQPVRTIGDALRSGIIDGGYWLREPRPGAEIAIAFSGAVAPEAIAAAARLGEMYPSIGLLAVTSADRLSAGWTAAQRHAEAGGSPEPSHVERLLSTLDPRAALVTVLDGHPATLGWLGSVCGHRVRALGVEHFGQTGTIPDVYRAYRIDADAIVAAALAAQPEGRRRGTIRR